MKLFGIAPVAVEDGDFGQDRRTCVVLDTAAKHGTEKSRAGAEAQAQRRFSTAPSSESFWEGAKDEG